MIVLRFTLLLIASWAAMTFTHETGHLVGGWLGGATLTECDLVPWRLPYSLHNPDPYPLLTLWAGPILGVMVPMLFALAFRWRSLRFVASFCLIANGAYIALAWISGDRFLDAARLLDAGASPVLIAVYCALTIGVGYWWFRSECVAAFRSPQQALRS